MEISFWSMRLVDLYEYTELYRAYYILHTVLKNVVQ